MGIEIGSYWDVIWGVNREVIPFELQALAFKVVGSPVQ